MGQLCKILPVIFLVAFLRTNAVSQSKLQDDFYVKMTEVYSSAADQKKAVELAKALLKLVDENKELNTYSNYYILNQIFETTAKDIALAKLTKDKADQAMAALSQVQTATTNQPTGNDPGSKWFNIYYPALFKTDDSDNARKASQFLKENPSLKTYDNLTYVAYAYERNGDYQKAKENYLLARSLKTDEKTVYHPQFYYINFLGRIGEYLEAEKEMKRLELLSDQAVDMFKTSYRTELYASKMQYAWSLGDFHTYLENSNKMYDATKDLYKNIKCDYTSTGRLVFNAASEEKLKNYESAGKLWVKYDSSYSVPILPGWNVRIRKIRLSNSCLTLMLLFFL
jgi:hypothetical protein